MTYPFGAVQLDRAQAGMLDLFGLCRSFLRLPHTLLDSRTRLQRTGMPEMP